MFGIFYRMFNMFLVFIEVMAKIERKKHVIIVSYLFFLEEQKEKGRREVQKRKIKNSVTLSPAVGSSLKPYLGPGGMSTVRTVQL